MMMFTRKQAFGILVLLIIAVISSAVCIYYLFPRAIEVPIPVKPKLKAAWIYIGPIGDYGWTFAHDQGRKYVEEKMPWLETKFVEAVPYPDAPAVIDALVAEGFDIIFTTSFGYMHDTIEAGKKYPDRVFMHCSGYYEEVEKARVKNVGMYFAEAYECYYLNGLVAGVMTKTNKLGYVAAHPIPEVIRHINAFALGAREVNPDATVHVIWIHAWYDPSKAREAAEALIAEGCDVLAFTEDTPTVLEVAQKYQEKGVDIWSFSHYSDMYKYGPDAHLTGQIVNWGVMYEEVLASLYAGVWKSEDMWWKMREGAFDISPLHPKVPEHIKELVLKRREEILQGVFDPFTGPIRDQEGVIRIEAGRRATRNDLWYMDYFVEGVVGEIPAPKL